MFGGYVSTRRSVYDFELEVVGLGYCTNRSGAGIALELVVSAREHRKIEE